MKFKFLYLSAALLILFFSCKKETIQAKRDPKVIQLPLKSQELIQKSNEFGIELFKATAQTAVGNLMLSPLSASTSLTMLLNGCSGETYNQIHQMLGYNDLTCGEVNATYQSLVKQLLEADKDVKLAIANSVWYRQEFSVKTPYLDTMETAFNAHVEKLDFSISSALSTINGWANENTNGKIPKVIVEIPADAVMFLMNALYFKGTWTQQFDKGLTGPGAFHLEDGSTINVSTMHGTIPSKVYSCTDFTAIELTYGRTNFSMVVIVPATNLSAFLENFNNQDWQNMTGSFDSNPDYSEIDVSLPRFKFTFEKILNDQLFALGMINAINPDLADLSGISDDDIYVTFVKQNTFIDVNEEGTEAAAVTTIGIGVTSMPLPFDVNKPFVFAIRERTTNTLLFLGKVVNPEY